MDWNAILSVLSVLVVLGLSVYKVMLYKPANKSEMKADMDKN